MASAAKRQRLGTSTVKLPLTYHAFEVHLPPEVSKMLVDGVNGQDLFMRCGRPGELVFMIRTDGPGVSVVRLSIEGGSTTAKVQRLEVSDVLNFDVDTGSGDVFFSQRSSDDSIQLHKLPPGAEADTVIVENFSGLVNGTNSESSFYVLPAPRVGLVVYSESYRCVQLLDRDGAITGNRIRLPDKITAPPCQFRITSPHSSQNPACLTSPLWFCFCRGEHLFRWDLDAGEVSQLSWDIPPSSCDLLLPSYYLDEDLEMPYFGACIARGGCLYWHDSPGLKRFDLHLGVQQRLDFVNAGGEEVGQLGIYAGEGSVFACDVQLASMKLYACTCDGRLFTSHLEGDLAEATLEGDLAHIDWTAPGRFVPFLVGQDSQRFEIDARILAARIDHFTRALESGMHESHNKEIQLRDVSVAAFHCFVKYLHTDHFHHALEALTGDSLETLLSSEANTACSLESAASKQKKLMEAGQLCLEVRRFADCYGILRLRRLALWTLRRVIQPSTALLLLQDAALVDSWNEWEEAPRACWEACRQFWTEIITSYGEQVKDLMSSRPSLALRLISSSRSLASPAPAIVYNK